MMIDTAVMKRLNSFENSELQRILETVETQVLYRSGLSKISGGYATAEAYDIMEDEDDTDLIEIEVESGENGCGYTDCLKTSHRLDRKVLGNQEMTLQEKVKAIEEA